MAKFFWETEHTKFTEFEPLADDTKPTGNFLSRLFKRKSDSLTQLKNIPETAPGAQAPVEDAPASAPGSTQGTPRLSRTHSKVSISSTVSAPPLSTAGNENNGSDKTRRNLTNVLTRLGSIIDGRSDTPQQYKDSDFKQYWMPDSSCHECYDCGVRFTPFVRRHHCRICGQIFCSKCCNQELPGKIVGYRGNLRVCTYCCKVVQSYTKLGDVKLNKEDLSVQTDTDAIFGGKDDGGSWWVPGIKDVGNPGSTSSKRNSVSSENTKPFVNPFDLTPQHEYPNMDEINIERRTLTKDSEQLRHIWQKIQDTETGVQMQQHRVRLRVYNNCIMASDILTWLEENMSARRDQAVAIGQALLDAAYIAPLISQAGSSVFQDDVTMYKPGRAAKTAESVSSDTNIEMTREESMEPLWVQEIETLTDRDSVSELNTVSLLNPDPHPCHSIFYLSHATEDDCENIVHDSEVGDNVRSSMGSASLPIKGSLQNDEMLANKMDTTSVDMFTCPPGWRNEEQLHAENGEILAYTRLRKTHDEHITGLVRQLLSDECLPLTWTNQIIFLAKRISSFVRPDVRYEGDQMDVRKYVQIKKIIGGHMSESTLVHGVVCTKNVAHKKMQKSYNSPKILLFKGSIEYQRVTNKFNSLEPQILQEKEFLLNIVSKIVAINPDILMVEKTVSCLAREYILETGITLVYNVKPSVMERVSRLTQATIIHSVDGIICQSILGFCHSFFLMNYALPNGKEKTYMFFDGCATHLGCTVTLMGGSVGELKRVKKILNFMIYVTYHSNLEISFCMDEFAMPPQTPDEVHWGTTDPDVSPDVTPLFTPDACLSKVAMAQMGVARSLQARSDPLAESLHESSDIGLNVKYMNDNSWDFVVDEISITDGARNDVIITDGTGETDITKSEPAKSDIVKSDTEHSDALKSDTHRPVSSPEFPDTPTAYFVKPVIIQSDSIDDSYESMAIADAVLGENRGQSQILNEILDKISDSSMEIAEEAKQLSVPSVDVNIVSEIDKSNNTIHSDVVMDSDVNQLNTNPLNSIPLLSSSPNAESNAKRKAEITECTDHSDPLNKYQKNKDESIFASSVSLTEQPSSFQKFRKQLDQIIVTISPFLRITIPFTETETGSRCKLRKYLGSKIFWSIHFYEDRLNRKRVKLFDVENVARPIRSKVMVIQPHALVVYNMDAQSNDKSQQAMLADYRARGGRIVQKPPQISHQSFPYSSEQHTRPDSFSDSLKTTYTADGCTWDRKIDCLDPVNHQRLDVLFSSHSFSSANCPNPCIYPWIVTMEFYGKNDITLGGFLEKFCFREAYTCPSSTCDTPMLDHIRRFVNGSGCVSILLRRLESTIPGHQTNIITWSWCRKCKQVSPVVPLSMDTWSMSFAKYIELRLNCNSFMRRASTGPCRHSLHHEHYQYFALKDIVASFKLGLCLNCNRFIRRGGTGPCRHSLHHEHYQYFALKDIVASFKYRPITIHEISFPSSPLIYTHPHIDFATIVEDTLILKHKAEEVYREVHERLTKYKNDCLLDKEVKTFTDGILAHQKEKQKIQEFSQRIEELLVQLRQHELDGTDAHDKMINVSYAISDNVAHLKRLLVEAVLNWNNRISELHQQLRRTEKTKSKRDRDQLDGDPARFSLRSLDDVVESDFSTHISRFLSKESRSTPVSRCSSLNENEGGNGSSKSGTSPASQMADSETDNSDVNDASDTSDIVPSTSHLLTDVTLISTAVNSMTTIDTLTMADDNLTMTDDNVTMTDDNIPSTNDLTSTNDNITSTNENFTTTEDNITTTDNNLKTTNDNLSTTGDNLSTTDANKSVNEIERSVVSETTDNLPSTNSDKEASDNLLSTNSDAETSGAMEQCADIKDSIRDSQNSVASFYIPSDGKDPDTTSTNGAAMETETESETKCETETADIVGDVQPPKYTSQMSRDSNFGPETIDGKIVDGDAKIASSFRKVDESMDSKTYKRTASVKNLISNFLSVPSFIPIQQPFPNDQHHCLPHTDFVPVIVYDDEPSSIIAYALSSRQYFTCLHDIQNLLAQANNSVKPGPNSVQQVENSTENTAAAPKKGVLSFFSAPKNSELSEPKERNSPKMARKNRVAVNADSHVKYTPSFDGDSYESILEFSDASSRFYCRVYFAEEFRQHRELIFPEGEDIFIRSLSQCFVWKATGGKSGSSFSKTYDDRFILKQMSGMEMESFEKFAPNYFEYIKQSYKEQKVTVLAKIVGVYRIGLRNAQTNSAMKQDLLVMENLFYGRNISQTFDLKGSMRNRLVDTTGKSVDELVLLDENLLKLSLDSPLYIRHHSKVIFNRAILRDVQFLSTNLVMDYSLLVGIDESHELVIGIIDYIRTFTWDKKLEMVVKKSGLLGGQGKMPTVVSPELYKSRFLDAMDRYFLLVPDRWFGLADFDDVKT